MITVYAPATVANVASGFDVLGFALENPGDKLEIFPKDEKSADIRSIKGDRGILPGNPIRTPHPSRRLRC